MGLVEEQNRFLADLAKLIQAVQSKGWMVTGGELFRTQEQQKKMVLEGKSKTLNSKHGKRKAIDLYFFKPVIEDGEQKWKITWKKEELAWIGEIWDSITPGNRWGGNFPGFVDVPHFEAP